MLDRIFCLTELLTGGASEYLVALFDDTKKLPEFQPKIITSIEYEHLERIKRNFLDDRYIFIYNLNINLSLSNTINKKNFSGLKKNSINVDVMAEHLVHTIKAGEYLKNIAICSDLDLHFERLYLVNNKYDFIYTIDSSERASIQNSVTKRIFENPFVFPLKVSNLYNCPREEVTLNFAQRDNIRIGISGSVLNSINKDRFVDLTLLHKISSLTIFDGFMNPIDYHNFIVKNDIIFCPTRNKSTVLTRALDAIGRGKMALVNDNSIMKILFPNTVITLSELDEFVNLSKVKKFNLEGDAGMIYSFSPSRMTDKFMKLIDYHLKLVGV